MAFCANCGAEVSGQFCPKCGTAVAAGGAASTAPAPVGSSAMSSNLASALCYLPFVGWIVSIVFLVIDPYKRDRTIRFHGWQSIGLAVVLLVVRVALMIVSSALTSISYGLLAMVGLISMLFGLGVLLLYIFLAVKAYQNQRIVLPVIGPFAEKQA